MTTAAGPVRTGPELGRGRESSCVVHLQCSHKLVDGL
eukprot:CAMPEP_0174299984 /NCGR_PEP_ID=MMETSP0809-20121228/58209_1 /TAXON_ID=73025 ORGANISM="Eutreptiella gymnastica-like, Strain CCMP1594" /NCGR_SAMPLE_ID=MMETSP0809 /ASSEMBLY_ACC=CAM_ASM_000658 /LENGTH=36 /DNA_ID= /DNA_START= /DNA_END= /DNA_ORIENTATION=